MAWIENRPADATGAAQLALLSLSDDALARLADGLERTLSREANPLFVDLEGDSLDNELEAHLPALNAATQLAPAHFASQDGLSIAVGARCPPDTRCVQLWKRGGDDLERRMRFLAWPYSAAAVVRAPDPSALYEAASRPEGTIALVIGAAERPGASRVRVIAGKMGAKSSLLSGLATPTPDRWSQLFHRQPGELVVIPRLGALSRLEEFNREVSGLATVRRQPLPFD